MPYVLDESSYRVDKTVFYSAEEAEQRAAEASRILNRPITVYRLANQVLDFAFRVLPDGSRDESNPTVESPPGAVVENPAPAVLGRRQALYDSIAEVLERQGRLDLAAYVDQLVGAASKDFAGFGLANKRYDKIMKLAAKQTKNRAVKNFLLDGVSTNFWVKRIQELFRKASKHPMFEKVTDDQVNEEIAGMIALEAIESVMRQGKTK